MANLSDLTAEQQEAIREFAARHGANWKQKLADGWLRAAYPGPLQQIRNERGPTWLRKLPQSDLT